MGRQKKISARRIALEVLNQFDTGKHDSRRILHEKIEQTGQKAQATDIVFGSIRNRYAIDMLIKQFSGLPVGRIKPVMLNILRIGVYELVFVSQTASYAAVNEAVNLAHAVAGKRQANFVNAVLRKISRMICQSNAKLKTAPPTRTMPVDARSGCEFMSEILPDPQADPAGYLSKAFSLHKWLITEWIEDFGLEKTRRICFASNRRPGVYLQTNTLILSHKEFADKLMSSGIEFDIVAGGGMFRLRTHKPVAELPGYSEGLFTVQDPTAADVAKVLAPKRGWTVLDLCAAPGGKTVRLAQLMSGRGSIIATDIDAERLKMVDDNCRRLGIKNVATIEYVRLTEAIEGKHKPDAIVLDVPCSNTGVLARRPEVRLRIKRQTVRTLTKIQLELLESSATMIARDAVICYSTCSIQRAENGDLIKTFLDTHPDFELQSDKLTLPFVADDESFDHDGGYVAILRKRY